MNKQESGSAKYILGISSPHGPVGAALIRDGVVVGAIREEYISRVKGSSGEIFPYRSTAYLLDTHHVDWPQVKKIAVSYDYTAIADPSLSARVLTEMQGEIEDRLGYNTVPPITYVDRHRAEAQLALNTSPYKDKPTMVAVLGLDAESSTRSSLWCSVPDREIQPIASFSSSDSPEAFFSNALHVVYKEFIDFNDFSMKVKNTGPRTFVEQNMLEGICNTLDSLFKFNKTGKQFERKASLPQTMATYLTSLSGDRETVERMYEYAVYMKVIDSLQQLILSQFQSIGAEYLCIAGDYAKSSEFNTSLYESGIISSDKLSVTPFPGGIASYVGAGMVASKETSQKKESIHLDTVFLGKSYSTDEIEQALSHYDASYIRFEKFKNLSARVADLLQEGKTIAWFQGGAELGPRALGNRNIITSLSNPEGASRLNMSKNTHPDKLVACALTEEEGKNMLISGRASATMSYNFAFNTHALATFPHLSNDVRPHIVSQKQNPRYWQLLSDLKERTGIAGVFKSSFNISGQVPVESPTDALALCNALKRIDYLVIDNYLVKNCYN